MDRAALRREALAWFRGRLATDDWMDGLRAETRNLKSVPPVARRIVVKRRARAKGRAA